jgi:hypothetical protein
LHSSSSKKSEKAKGKKKMEYKEVSSDSDDDEERERSDRDEEGGGFPLAAKYGPPIGRPKKAMADVDSGTAEVEKERNGKVADGKPAESRKTRNSSKRKRGNEEAENAPNKRSKPDGSRRPGRKTENSADNPKAPVGNFFNSVLD